MKQIEKKRQEHDKIQLKQLEDVKAVLDVTNARIESRENICNTVLSWLNNRMNVVHKRMDTIQKPLSMTTKDFKHYSERLKHLEKAVEDFTCVICMQRQRSVCFLPCSHSQFCGICAKKLSAPRVRSNKTPSCPICRQPIKEVLVLK